MKRIIYHYTVMRTLEVPEDFPTADIYELDMFIENRKEKINDYIVKERTDNCEIVDVEIINNSGEN